MSEEKPVYKFIRKGNGLFPEMELDLAALDGIAQEQGVKVEIKQWRSGPRLRAYWAILHECIEATGCAPNVGVLHDYIKLQTKHVELLRLQNGMTVAVPGSIAFNKMTEPEMVAFMETAIECLARDYGFVSEYKKDKTA